MGIALRQDIVSMLNTFHRQYLTDYFLTHFFPEAPRLVQIGPNVQLRE